MKKNNKRLLSAIATFGTSLALLVGGAFAWFSASANVVTDGQFVIGSLELTANLSEYIPPSDDPTSTALTGWQPTTSIDIDGMIPGDSKFYAIEAESVSNTTSTLSFTLTSGYTDDANEEFPDYLISKMIILDVTDVTSLPDAPTSGVADETVDVTTSDQPQPGSIYELTHDVDGSLKNYEKEITNSFEPGEANKIYIIMEFYFSGVAGNEYQLLTLTLEQIIVNIEQNPDIQIM